MEAAVGTRFAVGARTRAVPAAAALAVLIALNDLVRILFSALPLQTPVYLPDEYTYSALARGIAQTGHPVIRGVPAHFPALLEPLLAAPFWLSDNPLLALRLTQVEHEIVMSLAAIPVYLLCKRLQLGAGVSLAAAALTLLTPDFVFGSMVVTEPIAYPLVLAAVYAAVVALDTPSRRGQLAVVGLVGLACFARVQYVLLVPVFLAAALVVDRGSLSRARKSFGLAASLFAGVALVGLASGPHRVLGTYDAVFGLQAPLHTVLHQIGVHLLLVPFAAGVVLIPGALVGLFRGVTSPRSRAEAAFAVICSLLAGGLIAESVFVAATVSGNFGERYLFFFFPLLLPAFALYARRGGARAVVAGVAGVLVLLAVVFPLTDYSGRSSDSPTLWAVARIASWLGAANGALLLAVAAIVLALVAAYVGIDPGKRALLAVAAVLVAQGGIAAVATVANVQSNVHARNGALPADRRWVDDAGMADVTLVESPSGDPGSGIEQLLWNTSITRIALLPGARIVDSNANVPLRVTSSGTLDLPTGRLSGPLLVDRATTWTSFDGATLVRSTTNLPVAPFDLWRPDGARLRLAAEVEGLRGDNWLTRSGTVTIWPAGHPRRFTLQVGLPSKLAAADTIHFSGDATGSFTVQPDQRRTISFLVPAGTKPWTVRWFCDRYGFRNGQEVSFLSAPPRLTSAAGPLR
jgi:Dolichyl-phosphate-mannose-protein mannosyltransferase